MNPGRTGAAPRADVVDATASAFAALTDENVAFEVANVAPRVIHAREAALVAGAVEKRVNEFATGRWCAARSLARLGAPPQPILRGAVREPLWPRGFTGSIAHHGHVAAAAACAIAGDGLTAIGIDLADCSNLKPYSEIARLIACDGDELGFVEMAEPIAAAYLFSMKEAAVKCLSPGLQSFMDLVQLRLRPAEFGCRVDYQGESTHVVVCATQVDGLVISFAEAGSRWQARDRGCR